MYVKTEISVQQAQVDKLKLNELMRAMQGSYIKDRKVHSKKVEERK